MNTSYSEQQLRDAVKINFSIRQVLKTLGLKEAGGNYSNIKNKIKEYNIDNTHFTGQKFLKGKTHNWSKKIPLEEILVEYNNYNSHRLKLRLIKKEILKNECSECSTLVWEKQQLSLHLDHINGINTDNRIENLRLLCPNCHSLTPTYCGKNKKSQPKAHQFSKISKPKISKPKCLDCKKEITRQSKRCRYCNGMENTKPKIEWPTIEELKNRLKNSNYSMLGRELGVSDNAIRKRIKKYTV